MKQTAGFNIQTVFGSTFKNHHIHPLRASGDATHPADTPACPSLCYACNVEPRGPERAPNCLQCRHFIVTWDARFPRGCRVFGVKSRKLPSLVVFENTGRHCPTFEPTDAHRR